MKITKNTTYAIEDLTKQDLEEVITLLNQLPLDSISSNLSRHICKLNEEIKDIISEGDRLLCEGCEESFYASSTICPILSIPANLCLECYESRTRLSTQINKDQ